MPGLTAKVFRTYNASITLQQQLKELTNGKTHTFSKAWTHRVTSSSTVCFTVSLPDCHRWIETVLRLFQFKNAFAGIILVCDVPTSGELIKINLIKGNFIDKYLCKSAVVYEWKWGAFACLVLYNFFGNVHKCDFLKMYLKKLITHLSCQSPKSRTASLRSCCLTTELTEPSPSCVTTSGHLRRPSISQWLTFNPR